MIPLSKSELSAFIGGLLLVICGLVLTAEIVLLSGIDRCGPIFDVSDCFQGPSTLRWSLVAMGAAGALCCLGAGLTVCRRATQGDDAAAAWLAAVAGLVLAGLSIGAFVNQGADLP